MTDVMTRCSHGHFYDATKNSSCPYCGVNIDPVEGKTRRVPQTPPPAAARPAASAPESQSRARPARFIVRRQQESAL